MTAAAFQATYSDWKVIKGRKVVQVVFELPLELSDQAYQALGGMPVAAHEVWCGIARMNPKGGDETERDIDPKPTTETQPRPSAAQKAGADKPTRRFSEMSPAQQAGMLCNEPAFQVFLREKYLREWTSRAASYVGGASPNHVASEVICDLVGVERKRDINADNADWSSLVLAYRLWQREPEVVG